ncbi:MAG: hypothetical protein IBX57_00395 [Gammaproteobacteria bacterium]|nr:hypothetical protein [Gammaproteobacteria bacterium]
MSLMKRRPSSDLTATSVQKQQEAVVEQPGYESNVVDTRYTSARNLLTHIAGSSWIVNYYQQIVGPNNELSSQQMGKSAVYQQYTSIKDLELKVTSSLSMSQNQETKEFEVTGEATCYPPMIPNKGDMFIADIGDGTEGLFTVTETTRMSIKKDSVYNISYISVDVATAERKRDLESKVVKETHFVKRLLEHGEDPIIVTDEYNSYLSLSQYSESLIGNFFADFYNKSISSLSVPNQKLITFDPFVARTIKAFMSTTEHPLVSKIKLYSIELPGTNPPTTFWDAILRMSPELLPMASEKLGLVDARYFGVMPHFESVSYSNVRDVVYPVERNDMKLDHIDFGPSAHNFRDIRHQFETTQLGSLAQLKTARDSAPQNGIESLEPVYPVTKDDYYVFSESFYLSQESKQSQLEKLTRDVLNGKSIDKKVLSKLCESSFRWGSLERFYYTPILLILIKMVRRGM